MGRATKDFAKSISAKLILLILSSTQTAHLCGGLTAQLSALHPLPSSTPRYVSRLCLSLLQHLSLCFITICLWYVSQLVCKLQMNTSFIGKPEPRTGPCIQETLIKLIFHSLKCYIAHTTSNFASFFSFFFLILHQDIRSLKNF